MLRVFRLVHERGPETDGPFRGSTAANRWNREGTEAAYASESVAVCALEILAPWHEYPSLGGYRMFGLELEPEDVEDVRDVAGDLDVDDEDATRAFGEAWAAEGRSLALRVPTVVVPFGCNYVVNPRHPRFDAGAIRDLGPFRYDDRIVGLIDAAKKERGER